MSEEQNRFISAQLLLFTGAGFYPPGTNLMRILLSFILLAFTACSSLGNQNPDGVYAGVALFPGMNGAMDLITYTYYFRPDGTFSSELDKPDWKTRTDGNYQLQGSKLIMKETKDKHPDTLTVKPDGSLDMGSTVLNKFRMVSSLPAKRFYSKSASSVGGIGTGMVYVGAFSNSHLAFDGKGHFSHSRFSAVAVTGDNIGGGTNNASGGDGDASIKDGELTLRYKDGKQETKTFFYAEKPEIMALVNGTFYFEDDGKEEISKPSSKASSGSGSVRNDKEESETAGGGTATTAPDANTLLQQAHEAHGGARLDGLQTLKMEGRLNNLPVVIYADVAAQRLRYEVSNKGKVLAVEQLEGNSGWQWAQGKQTSLPPERIKEMKEAFYTGFMALRSNVLKRVKPGQASVDEKTGLVTLPVTIDGKPYAWVFDKQNRLGGEVSKESGGVTTTLSTNYREVSGVWIPFKSVTQAKGASMPLILTNAAVNETLPATVWDKPVK